MFLARLGNQVWAKLCLEPPTRGPKTPARPAFCRHYLLNFLEMQQISSGQRGRHYLRNFLDMRRKTCTKRFRNGAQKKVPESAGLVRDDHSRSLTKYFPPMEAATAADLAQAFEPVLRRLRQQPTWKGGGLGGRSPQEKVFLFFVIVQQVPGLGSKTKEMQLNGPASVHT